MRVDGVMEAGEKKAVWLLNAPQHKVTSISSVSRETSSSRCSKHSSSLSNQPRNRLGQRQHFVLGDAPNSLQLHDVLRCCASHRVHGQLRFLQEQIKHWRARVEKQARADRAVRRLAVTAAASTAGRANATSVRWNDTVYFLEDSEDVSWGVGEGQEAHNGDSARVAEGECASASHTLFHTHDKVPVEARTNEDEAHFAAMHENHVVNGHDKKSDGDIVTATTPHLTTSHHKPRTSQSQQGPTPHSAHAPTTQSGPAEATHVQTGHTDDDNDDCDGDISNAPRNPDSASSSIHAGHAPPPPTDAVDSEHREKDTPRIRGQRQSVLTFSSSGLTFSTPQLQPPQRAPAPSR